MKAYMDNKKLEELLLTVQKPGRYVGGEWNAVRKEWTPGRVKFLLAFPDTYEVGMSNLGIKILYGILNNRDDCLAERVFAPWKDFEAVLRNNDMELFSLESRRPIKEFDIIGFSLSYELCYTNVLNILDLGGIPKESSKRREDDPLIIAGGPACFNPEPMAEFFDAFVIGDGEDVVLEIVELCKKYKYAERSTHNAQRKELLRQLANIKGVYVPSLYRVSYNADGTIKEFVPTEDGAPDSIEKRVVEDLDSAFYPVKQIVPNIQVVHDRIAIEIMRGCKHACSFCQATTIYRPWRERSKDKILELARQAYAMTGYDEISLLSLSSVDHSRLKEMIEELSAEFCPKSVSLSVPSLRIEDAIEDLPALISKVKKSGLTFAPEAGSEKLRKSINKNIDMEKLFKAASGSFRAGWRHVKLYFMIGLPLEDDNDILRIAELIHKVSSLRKEIDGKAAQVTVSINPFIPKARTRFERAAMDSIETLEKKKDALKRAVKSKFIVLDFHSSSASLLEAVFARGDRRLASVVLDAWKRGARFDGWSEGFDFNIWASSFKDACIDPAFYASRTREAGEILPWSKILPQQ